MREAIPTCSRPPGTSPGRASCWRRPATAPAWVDAAQGYGSTNFNDYGNPELDALVEKAAGILSMTERRTTLQEAIRRMSSDLYLLPLATPLDRYGVRSDLAWEPRLDRFLLGREMVERP